MTIIWDLDGTLIDSYKVIVPSVCEALKEYNIELSSDYVHEFIIAKSCGELFNEIGKKINVDANAIKSTYSDITHKKDIDIKLLPYAYEVLDNLNKRGINNIIYTHRGSSTKKILDSNDISKFFIDVIDSTYSFKRKPDPEGLEYIIAKHNLDKKDLIYVGDRSLDMECAKRASIKGVLIGNKTTGFEDLMIDNLLDLLKYI